MDKFPIGKAAKQKKPYPGERSKRIHTTLDGGKTWINFKSRAEWNYAIRLNVLKRAGMIQEWAYEPRFFEFDEIRHGTTRYKPDFEVTNNDGTTEFFEIKGYLTPKDVTKMKRMRKYHPNVKITMLDSKKFQPMDWENLLKK